MCALLRWAALECLLRLVYLCLHALTSSAVSFSTSVLFPFYLSLNLDNTIVYKPELLAY